MYLEDEHVDGESKYYVVKKKAVPEVLIKVVEVKSLLNTYRSMTIKEATDLKGISRSSFYKYKDDIYPFNDSAKGKTITLSMQIMDEPGLLSDMLHIVALYHANILTIHQSIPVTGIASISLSVEVLPETGNISKMVSDIEAIEGIYDVKILARE